MIRWVFLLCLFALHLAGQNSGEVLAAQAVEAEKQGDFPRAISLFQQALKNGNDSAALRSNLGLAYYQAADNKKALAQFRLVLKTTPDSVPANFFSGLSYLRLRQPKKALPYLENAYKLQPGAVAIGLALARAEVASNHIARAHALYERAARLEPRNAEAWYGVGITDRVLAENELKTSKAKAQMHLQESEAAIAKALQIDPGAIQARMLFAESLRIAERYGESIREYKAVTEQRPDLASAWAGLAAAYAAAGDTSNAINAAMRAGRLEPNDADTNALLAALFLRQGEYDKAEPYATRALEMQPHLSGARVVLAKIYLAQHQPQRALPELERAVKDDTDGGTYYLLATALRQLGRDNEASVALRKYKELHSGRITAAAK